MGLKLNKFSSRILDVRNHSIWEGIVVQLFFLVILGGLISLAFKSNTPQVIFLYFGAAAVVLVVTVIDLYFIFSNLASKGDDPEDSREP